MEETVRHRCSNASPGMLGQPRGSYDGEFVIQKKPNLKQGSLTGLRAWQCTSVLPSASSPAHVHLWVLWQEVWCPCEITQEPKTSRIRSASDACPNLLPKKCWETSGRWEMWLLRVLWKLAAFVHAFEGGWWGCPCTDVVLWLLLCLPRACHAASPRLCPKSDHYKRPAAASIWGDGKGEAKEYLLQQIPHNHCRVLQ